MTLRFKLPPGGDVPPETAARRMGMTLAAFKLKLDELRQRGFPPADPTTGNYDLDAIDAWRRARNPQLFGQPSLTRHQTARNASDVVASRLARSGGG
jgi:hypothetical protein